MRRTLCLWRPFLDLSSVSRGGSVKPHSRPLVAAVVLCLSGFILDLWSAPLCVARSQMCSAIHVDRILTPSVSCAGRSPKVHGCSSAVHVGRILAASLVCTAAHVGKNLAASVICARQFMSVESGGIRQLLAWTFLFFRSTIRRGFEST